jgi:hypothetical protein
MVRAYKSPRKMTHSDMTATEGYGRSRLGQRSGMSPEAVCLTDAVSDVDPAYAIVRVDLGIKDDEARDSPFLASSGARS